MNSAKGGRAARGAVKARASKIGWERSPNRFGLVKERSLAERERRPKPDRIQGFICSCCHKWHEYPQDMDLRTKHYHTCGCGAQHVIWRGVAEPINGEEPSE